MIEGKLEIFIFTYNRAGSLKRTLEQLAASPVGNCRITVLDNHSSDETSSVCANASRILRKFRAVRHPKNIGGLANYLRAIELAEADYTWVICDDDSFDFSRADDLFQEITAGKTDVISAGVHGHNLTPGSRGNLLEFAMREPFFFCHSFVPSMIFRTALFHSQSLREGYDNIETMFPHFPFLIRITEANASIYVSRNKIIQKSNNVGYSTFRFMSGWLKSCRRIALPELKKKVLGEVFGGKMFVQTLLYSCLIERQFRPQQCKPEFKALRAEAGLTNRIIWASVLPFTPLVYAPDAVHRSLWKRYSAYRARQGNPVPNFDEER